MSGEKMENLTQIKPNYYTKYHYRTKSNELLTPVDICEFYGFTLGNVFKYLLRYKDKNGAEDLIKALTYLNQVNKYKKVKTPKKIKKYLKYLAQENELIFWYFLVFGCGVFISTHGEPLGLQQLKDNINKEIEKWKTPPTLPQNSLL